MTTPAERRAVATIGWPLPTVEAVLRRGSPETNTWFDVALALDHDEAAGFVRQDWDKITAYWEGTDAELAFLQGMLREFPSPERTAGQ